MGKRSIQPNIRARAVALYQSGLNFSTISEQIKISRCCLRKVIIKFEQDTSTLSEGTQKKILLIGKMDLEVDS